MASVVEFLRVRIIFMNRRGNERINLAVFEALTGHGERAHGIAAAGFGEHARLDGYILFPAVKDIHLFGVQLGDVFGVGKVEGRFFQRFAVEIQHTGRGENNRGAHVQHAVIREGLDNYLRANAVEVADANAYDGFFHGVEIESKTETETKTEIERVSLVRFDL